MEDMNKQRGAAIERRMKRQNITQREMGRRLKMDPKTVARALAGEPNVSQGTYDRLEAALSDVEAYRAAGLTPPEAVAGAVTYHFEDGSGVNLTVQGPVEEMRDLGAQFGDMVDKALSIINGQPERAE